jgi:hypothetical protein
MMASCKQASPKHYVTTKLRDPSDIADEWELDLAA